MHEKPQTHRPAARPVVAAATHKFALGAYVALTGKSDDAVFQITRLLPDGGSGPQYRIKNAQEGYERVAAELLLPLVRK